MMFSGGELAVIALAVPKAEKTGLGMDGKGSFGRSFPSSGEVVSQPLSRDPRKILRVALHIQAGTRFYGSEVELKNRVFCAFGVK